MSTTTSPPLSPRTCEIESSITLPRIETPSNDSSEEGQSDGDCLKVRDITAEDAQSIFQVSISRAATHLTSAKTPAAEKAAAFEDRPDGYFDVNSVLKSHPGASTPPGVREESSGENDENDNGNDKRGRTLQIPTTQTKTQAQKSRISEARPEIQRLPSPWQSHSSKNASVGGRLAESRSALQEAFGPLKRRSLSGSGDALKKFLPKGLPSMPKASSFMPSTASFFSSNGQTKDRSMSLQNGSVPANSSPLNNSSSPMIASTGENKSAERPPMLRRVTSHESSLTLYHTPSRSSSLGDDSRWVNVSEQVNSRGKAIIDSIQDRSYFKFPSVNMPSMPSFNFNLNHFAFFSTASLPVNESGETNTSNKDILPTGKKAGSSTAPSSPKVETAQESADYATMSHFDRALSKLTGDIVVMGGYRGSVLRCAKTHRQVWVPMKVGLNIRKVNLEVGLEDEDEEDENMRKLIYPSGMLTNIGPVDISKRLFKKLRESPNAKNGTLRVHDYGYDWRLSPHILSKQLQSFLQALPCNQDDVPKRERGAFVIAHSLGGLITRHAINQRPELVSGVVYAGVPQVCVNILGPLRNGDAVLLSSRVLTAQVNFTLRTSFVFLPEDGRCFKDINTGEEYPVNFFDPEEWIKYRWSPCIDPPLPPILPQSTGLTNLIPLIGRKSSISTSTSNANKTNGISSNGTNSNGRSPAGSAPQSPTKTTHATNFVQDMDAGKDRTLAPKMAPASSNATTSSTSTSYATTVTIPRPEAIKYLTRTLQNTLAFKRALHFIPSHQFSNLYPPAAIIYGKETPTCAGAKVLGREGIACADSYDHLAFGSGDGVVLAKEAMLPEGYHCVKGGRVSSERGHVTLLGDLRAVGRAMDAVLRGRGRGIGLGICGEEGRVGEGGEDGEGAQDEEARGGKFM